MAHDSGSSKRWWLVGGACACAVLLLVTAGAAGGALWYFSLRQTPQDVVEQYLDAWNAQDCETFEEITTETFRGEDYSCSEWQQDIAGQEDLDFDQEIGGTEIEGGRADVRVTQVMTDDGTATRSVYDLVLIKQDGDWLLETSQIIEEPQEI